MLRELLEDWLRGEGLDVLGEECGFFVRNQERKTTVWLTVQGEVLVVGGFATTDGGLKWGQASFDSACPSFFEDLLGWVREHVG